MGRYGEIWGDMGGALSRWMAACRAVLGSASRNHSPTPSTAAQRCTRMPLWVEMSGRGVVVNGEKVGGGGGEGGGSERASAACRRRDTVRCR